MKFCHIILYLGFILFFSYCARKVVPGKSDRGILGAHVDQEHAEDLQLDVLAVLPKDSVSRYLQSFSDSAATLDLFILDGEYMFSRILLPALYKKRNYQLTWLDPKNRADAIECLEKSWHDGLQPSDYHLVKIKSLLDELESDAPTDFRKAAVFDVLLTDGIFLYSYHLLQGKVEPQRLDINWNYTPRQIPKNTLKLYIEALNNHTIPELVYQQRPQLQAYNFLIEQRIRYEELKQNGGWYITSFPGKSIKPGERDELLPSIRKRLTITGDLDIYKADNELLYDDILVAAVKRFQERHGLQADGVIGRNTIEAMNVTVEQRINQINVNLERARWVVHDLSRHMILVNIANFKLYYYLDSVKIWETKAMVGTYYNQTPVFKSRMQYLVFNPTWTVPYSIATKEILPKLRTDSAYLADRNMTLLNASGKTISQGSVDWKSVTSSNFNYTIRQEPGPGNALGQVKFMFPNKFSVYLHDTPSKYLFAKDERAFSHGCIRVQYPLQLAELLLRDKGYNATKIQEVLSGSKERTVNLSKAVDVLLLYWTCGAMDNGDIFFLRDIYNRDRKVLPAIQNTDWRSVIAEYHRKIGVLDLEE